MATTRLSIEQALLLEGCQWRYGLRYVQRIVRPRTMLMAVRQCYIDSCITAISEKLDCTAHTSLFIDLWRQAITTAHGGYKNSSKLPQVARGNLLALHCMALKASIPELDWTRGTTRVTSFGEVEIEWAPHLEAGNAAILFVPAGPARAQDISRSLQVVLLTPEFENIYVVYLRVNTVCVRVYNGRTTNGVCRIMQKRIAALHRYLLRGMMVRSSPANDECSPLWCEYFTGCPKGSDE